MPAGRKSTLLTHVEADLDQRVKKAADEAGMTASSYIRKLLLDVHPAPRKNGKNSWPNP